ncbi:MAG: heme-dependent oxidative N-demethylase family protein [Jhaorihella sp.]
MAAILHTRLPYDPFAPRPLPGVQPLALDEWLLTDEAHAGQMALRDRLLANRRDAVLAMDESARPAARELLGLVLSLAYPDAGSRVERPDGVGVHIDRGDPMGTLGRLVQEDLCILQKPGDEHVLTAATLCFPASWMLSEKFMRPLIGIHQPVDSYDSGIAARVQRLFDGVQPGRPLWRCNALWYDRPDLHQPRGEAERRKRADPAAAGWLRSERQCILRLPQTRAVVFSIHTYVLARADLPGTGLPLP